MIELWTFHRWLKRWSPHFIDIDPYILANNHSKTRDKSLKLAARKLYEANPPVDVNKYRDEIYGFINDVASSSQFALESHGTAEKDENVKRAFAELRIDLKEKRNAAWQALKEGKAVGRDKNGV